MDGFHLLIDGAGLAVLVAIFFRIGGLTEAVDSLKARVNALENRRAGCPATTQE